MRIRDIKPGFYINEQLAECSAFARLIFPGLWMIADREGRFEWRPKRLRAEILPYDRVNMEKLLGELEAQGLIVHYTINGKDYGWIPTFTQHQKPHPNEKASEIPPCPLEDIPNNKTSNIKVEPEYNQEETEEIKNINHNDNNDIPKSTNEILRCEASNTKVVINPSALTASLLNGDIKGNLNTTPLPPASGGDGAVSENQDQAISESQQQKPKKAERQKPPNPNSPAEIRKAMNVYAKGNEQLAKELANFQEMRDAKKKPMTARALELILAKLDDFSGNDDVLKIKLLGQSIVKDWIDIYPLQEDASTSPQMPANMQNLSPGQKTMLNAQPIIAQMMREKEAKRLEAANG